MLISIALSPRLRLALCLGLSALAVTAYVPAQFLPLIADDYVQIDLGRRYGPIDSWDELARDALYRCRATSIVLTWWTEKIFGISRAAFNATNLIVHVVNVLLVLALGMWRPIGWRVAAVAAAFFAIAEGHQEAVIWYAALPEALVFTFTLATLLAWIGWIQSGGQKGSLYALAVAGFMLALLSKESAVCVVGLQALAAWMERPARRRYWIGMVPFAAASLVYFWSIYAARSSHLHFNDGTFSLTAPFYLTLVNSVARMFWVSGAVALVILWAARRLDRRFIALTAAWCVITLLPYSFLTYMTRVPSRHTYLASVALAWVAGAALIALRERWPDRRYLVPVVAAVLVTYNLGYLWSRKHRQYRERAAATEELIRFARQTSGPIYVRCFPYAGDVAVLAVTISGAGDPERVRWTLRPGCTGLEFGLQPPGDPAEAADASR